MTDPGSPSADSMFGPRSEITGTNMTASIEACYDSRIDQLSGPEKLARVEAMLAWTRDCIARQIRSELGPSIGDERLRWEVALRMYGSDAGVSPWIRERLSHVSS
jgi:hypothetical protein